MIKKYFIGLSSTLHDSSIAIVDDKGKILFAESTERYLQHKRAIGIPADLFLRIQLLLDLYCKDGTEFHLCTSWSKRHLWTLRVFDLFNLNKLFSSKRSNLFIDQNELNWQMQLQFASNILAGKTFLFLLKNLKKKVVEHRFDHHLCHAAFACYSSVFNQAPCVVIDGAGEKGSISVFDYKDEKIKLISVHKGFESLGGFYILLTRLCGFNANMGEEWKTMGLAAYGQFNNEFYLALKSLMKVENAKLKWIKKSSISKITDSIVKHLALAKDPFKTKADLAYTGQKVFGELSSQILQDVYKKKCSNELILTGGCALNSSYNGKIILETSFKNIYIPPAPADDGNSVGAAWLAFKKIYPQKKLLKKKPLNPYLGSEIENSEIEKFIYYSKIKHQTLSKNELNELVAVNLAEGKIIAWVQGRAEFGPRALGNRSILADPRSESVRDRLNNQIKFRESFRPFAPAVLAEFANLFFENYQDSPYMERTLSFKKSWIKQLPAVSHVDGTGRLQTVFKKINPSFHELISTFNKLTGVPMLLNTSLNIMGKPMIHSMSDAVTVFLGSDIDILVVNQHVFRKN